MTKDDAREGLPTLPSPDMVFWEFGPSLQRNTVDDLPHRRSSLQLRSSSLEADTLGGAGALMRAQDYRYRQTRAGTMGILFRRRRHRRVSNRDDDTVSRRTVEYGSYAASPSSTSLPLCLWILSSETQARIDIEIPLDDLDPPPPDLLVVKLFMYRWRQHVFVLWLRHKFFGGKIFGN